VEKLFGLSVDALICSIWAGNSESYIRTHPFADNKTFEKIRQILLKIKYLKESNNNSSPKILIHNVICNLNYKDVINMIDFGIDVGAEELRFTPIDIVSGETDALLLSESQNMELLDLLEQEKIGAGRSNILRKKDKSIYISGVEIFIERTKKRKGVNVDQEMIKKLPCTIGWLFAIIHPTGDVIPCCKGGRHPMGNILRNSIKEIWRSRQYGEFRKKARDLSKDDPYFKNIKCFKFCDNISDLIAYDPRNNDMKMKTLFGRFITASKHFRKLPERILDEIFKTRLPAANEINEYLPLPLEGLEMNDSDKRNALWPLSDLQGLGFFRDDSGPRRAKKIQDKYSLKK
jgi:radical SAM protein with 4Fe4S-binding SPASM domain